MDYSRSSSYSSRSSNAPSIQKSASSSSRSSRSSTPISYSSSSSSPALPLAGSSKSNSSVSSHGGGNLGNLLTSHSPLRSYSAPDFQKAKKKTGPVPSPYIYGTQQRPSTSPSQNLHKPDPRLPTTGQGEKPKPDAQLAGLLCSTDPDELKLAGNEYYRQGRFAESLQLYSRAVQVLPPNQGDSQLRANRAATLLALGRVGEAVSECEAAIKCDPGYKRARQRIAGLLARLGRCADARNHLALLGSSYEKGVEERMRVMAVEEAIQRMQQLVQAGEWESATRQAEAVVRAGGDLVPQVWLLRAHCFRQLHRLEEAETAMESARSSVAELLLAAVGGDRAAVVGAREAECQVVDEDVHLEFLRGRFDIALSKAQAIAARMPHNPAMASLHCKAGALAHCRSRGNDLFNAGNFTGALAEYSQGIRLEARNPTLLSNRAACFAKLGRWQEAVKDCTVAVEANPSFSKALLRRAHCYTQMEQWVDAHADYERLQRMMPGDELVSSELRKIKDRLLRRSCSSSSAATTPSASPTFRSTVESRALVPAGTSFSSSTTSSAAPTSLPALPSTITVSRSTSSLSGLSNGHGMGMGMGVGIERGVSLVRQSSVSSAGRPAGGFAADGYGNVRVIASEEDYGRAVANMGLVVVQFFAKWCAVCKETAPGFARLSTSISSVLFFKLDVDAYPRIVTREAIKSVPTFIVFQHGRRGMELIGSQIQQLEEAIRRQQKALKAGF